MSHTDKSADIPQGYVKLSPAAKSFVPEAFSFLAQNSSVTQQQQQNGLLGMSPMPHYITPCYPFINYDYTQNLQWHAQEYDKPLVASEAMYGSEQLMDYKDKWNVCSNQLPSTSTLPGHPDVTATGCLPPHPPPSCSAWTGGLETAWKSHDSSIVQPWWHGSNKWIITSAEMFCEPALSTNQKPLIKHAKRKADNHRVSIGVQYESSLQPGARSGTARTIICKDCEVQTDFPEELSKLSLIEQPSPLYCKRKVDLWRHINDTELEEAQYDSGYCTPYHNQFNAMPAVNSSYLSVIPGTHAPAGPLMVLPHELPPYRFSQVGSTLDGHNYSTNNGTGCQSNWYHTHAGPVNAADGNVLLQANITYNVGTYKSRQPSLRQHNTATLIPDSDNMVLQAPVIGQQVSQASVAAAGANALMKMSTETGKPAYKSTSVSAKECTKITKKKKKRKAHLSRAADAELAEISLEQQVLREMMLSQQLTDSKAVQDASELRLNPAVGPVKDSWRRLELKPVSDTLSVSAAISPLSDTTDHLNASAISSTFIRQYTRTDSATGSSQSSSQCNGCGSAGLSSPVSQTSPMTFSSPSASPASSGMLSPAHNDRVSLQTTCTFSKPANVISKIHSRRFREYCNQVLSGEIDECCTQLLQHLVRFQDHMYQSSTSTSSNNGVLKRRTVLGLREVAKNLKMSKLKAVIISPNVENVQSKEGLDEALNSIIEMCQQQRVPLVFALGRRALGRACAKPVPVSVVGIFSYEGVETYFRRLCELTEQARRTYQDIVAALEHETQQDEALQVDSAKTEDSVSQSTDLELCNSDNKCTDSDAT